MFKEAWVAVQKLKKVKKCIPDWTWPWALHSQRMHLCCVRFFLSTMQYSLSAFADLAAFSDFNLKACQDPCEVRFTRNLLVLPGLIRV